MLQDRKPQQSQLREQETEPKSKLSPDSHSISGNTNQETNEIYLNSLWFSNWGKKNQKKKRLDKRKGKSRKWSYFNVPEEKSHDLLGLGAQCVGETSEPDLLRHLHARQRHGSLPSRTGGAREDEGREREREFRVWGFGGLASSLDLFPGESVPQLGHVSLPRDSTQPNLNYYFFFFF